VIGRENILTCLAVSTQYRSVTDTEG